MSAIDRRMDLVAKYKMYAGSIFLISFIDLLVTIDVASLTQYAEVL